MHARQATLRLRFLAFLVLPILGAVAFLPGIDGPYVFDDYSNLLKNQFIQVSSIDSTELHRAAYSIRSGPLQRPVAMLSFALNHYLAGGFENPRPFKVTNLLIHALNAVLVFWFVRMIFDRMNQVHPAFLAPAGGKIRDSILLSTAVAFIWVVHPIQLTSVLYVVQRMTELAALFTLLGLITYLTGRIALGRGNRSGLALLFFGPIVFGALGVLCKENALLLPLFILVLELCLFCKENPWRWLRQLSHGRKFLISAAGFVALLVCLSWAIHYVIPGFSGRPFSLYERLLTESRVLHFYVALIVLPRIDQFALFHDDIFVSKSLTDPWTTLPAVFSIIFFACTAFALRKRYPLFTLGVLWFYVGHLLESTIIPLEITHEHRNYLPSLGIFLALVQGVGMAAKHLRERFFWGALIAFALACSVTTILRATHWSNSPTLYTYEALHHPDSAIAQFNKAIMLSDFGQYDEARQALERASTLDPGEASYPISLDLLAIRNRYPPDEETQKKILNIMSTGALSASTISAIGDVAGCLSTWCGTMDTRLRDWMRAILARKSIPGDESYYQYLLGIGLAHEGRTDEAIFAFHRSYQLDPMFLHPLFKLASLHLRSGNVDAAERVLSELSVANRENPRPRDKEIAVLAEIIQRMKGAGAITKR